jgi:hypothetical protein
MYLLEFCHEFQGTQSSYYSPVLFIYKQIKNIKLNLLSLLELDIVHFILITIKKNYNYVGT